MVADGRAKAIEAPPAASAWQRLAPSPWWQEGALARIEAVLAEEGTRAALEHAERAGDYPADVVDRMKGAGFAELLAGEVEDAGTETTVPHAFTLNALVARRNGSLAITLGVNFLALLPAYVAGDDAQLAGIFGRVRAGAFSSLLLTELAHGSNLAASETTAERDGDAYVVRGEKDLINGGTQHALLFTLARTTAAKGEGAAAGGARGDLSLLLVERDESVEALPRWRTLPMRAADIAGVRFHGTRVPLGAAIGGEGNGFGVVQKALRISRGGIGALASGAASAAFEVALAYARERRVFGAPILAFDAIAEHVLHAAALDRIIAATAIRAAMLTNALGVGAAHATAVAKYACCALAEEAVTEARRVLASRALTEEFGFERIVRDVLLYSVFDGTSHVIADELQWRLTQFAASASQGDRDALAPVRAAYAAKPRHLVHAARTRAAVDLTPLAARLHALAGIPSSLDVAPLAGAADALVEIVLGARAGGRWDRDQALRLAAADALARLEAVSALVELGDPARRAALGVAPLSDPFDGVVTAYAVSWFGARACELVTRVALACDVESACARSFAATRTLMRTLPSTRALLVESLT